MTIYDINKGMVVNEIYPERCWKKWMEGKKEREEIVIEFDEMKDLVFYHYRTNSNRGRVIFYNIPPSLTFSQATELVRRIFDFDEISIAEMAKPAFNDEHQYSMYYYKPLQ